MKTLNAGAWICALLVLSTETLANDRVIYGKDNRSDLYEIADEAWLNRARSTVALFESKKIKKSEDPKISLLTTSSYAKSYNLCSNERFYEQNLGAFCSGTLVGKDTILTAGHCVTVDDNSEGPTNCKNINFVFGFGIYKQGENAPSEIPTEDIYACKKIIRRLQKGDGADYAIIQLDREVKNRTPMKVHSGSEASNGTPILVIGHPAGLPTKLSDSAEVKDNSEDGYFQANLDTYGGNSGSGVFNLKTGEIEGVLVRGNQDYTYFESENCYRSKVCLDSGCNKRFEDVTKASAFVKYIPK